MNTVMSCRAPFPPASLLPASSGSGLHPQLTTNHSQLCSLLVPGNLGADGGNVGSSPYQEPRGRAREEG